MKKISELTPEEKDIMTFTEFLKGVHMDYLTDDDGFGYWANENKDEYDESIRVLPSEVVARRKVRPKWATHLFWVAK